MSAAPPASAAGSKRSILRTFTLEQEIALATEVVDGEIMIEVSVFANVRSTEFTRVSQVQTTNGRAIVQVHLAQGIPPKGKGKFWAAVTSNLNSKEWKSVFRAAPAVADNVEKTWERILATRMSQLQVEAKKREGKKGDAKACVERNPGEDVSGEGDRDDTAAAQGGESEVEPGSAPYKQQQ